MGTSTIELAEKLLKVASQHGGYFTAAQAVTVGYADSTHGYHIRNGDWERAGRGVYRLVGCPPSKWARLFLFLLWSRGRDGAPQGTFCRQSALLLHGVESRNGGPVHMIVPPSFRRNTPIPTGLRVYHETVAPNDIVILDGLPATKLGKTMSDLGLCSTEPKISARSLDAGQRELGFWDAPAVTSLRTTSEWSGGLSFNEAISRGED